MLSFSRVTSHQSFLRLQCDAVWTLSDAGHGVLACEGVHLSFNLLNLSISLDGWVELGKLLAVLRLDSLRNNNCLEEEADNNGHFRFLHATRRRGWGT